MGYRYKFTARMYAFAYLPSDSRNKNHRIARIAKY